MTLIESTLTLRNRVKKVLDNVQRLVEVILRKEEGNDATMEGLADEVMQLSDVTGKEKVWSDDET